MNIKNFTLAIALLLAIPFLFTQCTFDKETSTVKFASTDPFRETVTPSQTFTIVGKEDNVVEGKNGTLIVIPAGSFKDANGNTVDEEIEIELTEAFSLEDMILSNLTTTSDGNLLQTDGMLYLNATMGGKQLHIDADNPLYIEIPTEKKIPGMMAYKGVRDENGNMNWIEPKELEKFLVTVDMDLLNFLPNGFQSTVEAGMPFRKHQSANKELVDSLYYSLTPNSALDLTSVFESVDLNEPYYNKNKNVGDGKYSDASYDYSQTSDTSAQAAVDTAGYEPCGINPASIKVIKSNKYQNTLIATREFETRLQTIFKTCNTDILEIYINGLGKSLWELDSTAMVSVSNNELAPDFENYYKQKLTNVENGKVYAALLQGYYKGKLTEINNQLNAARAKVEKELKQKNDVAQKVATEYKELLFKREKFRMEKYGFEWTSTGWINIDKGTIPKDWGPQPLDVIVENGKSFDRVYTYVAYTFLKSIYRLNSSDNKTFHVGNNEDREMLMPKKSLATAISIGYVGDEPAIAFSQFETGTPELKHTLVKSSMKEVREMIGQYDNYAQENRIDKDLAYMAFFAKEKKRQEKLREEAKFIQKLVDKAFPCCAEILDGKVLYNMHCSSCHIIDKKMIGPALAMATTNHSMDWLIRFTRNNYEMRKNGDAYAINVFEEYRGSVMPTFELSEEQIKAIYEYIDDFHAVTFE